MLEENVQKLFREYFPGEGTFHRHVDRLFPKKRVKNFDVSMHVFQDVFRAITLKLGKEKPTATYKQFKEEFDRRAKTFIKQFPRNLTRASWVLEFSPKKSFEQSLQDVALTLRESKKWGRKKTFKVGKFIFRHQTFRHPESPLCWVISLPSKRFWKVPVATIGFTLHKDKENVVMRMTTAQGELGKHKQILQLEATLGKQWRVALVEMMKKQASRSGWHFEAREPFNFVDTIHQTEEDLERVKIRMRRTFKKARLKPGKRKHIWHPK
jgi:hypothetical protein